MAAGGSAGARVGAATHRLREAWQTLAGAQRMAAVGGLGLVATMLLPWYATSPAVAVRGRPVTTSHSALFTLGWVELAILMVAAAVLTLLYMRAERRAFHLPGGDGTVLLGAGVWVVVLLLWRLFDGPTFGRGVAVTLDWGFFVACAAAGFLVVAGVRVRAEHVPEPPLPRHRERDGEPTDVWLDDDRPHLAETRILGGEAPTGRQRPHPPAVSRGRRPGL